jgi:branched-chain amino acid transport system permease protein
VNILSALVVGLGAGALYAVLGVGLTLMSVLTRVINFSLVAVGVFGAYLSIRLIPLHVPTPLVVLVAVLVAAALSAALGLIEATWLPEASSTARSAVTVASLLMLVSVSYLLFGTRPQALRPLLVGPAFTSGQFAVTKVSLAMLIAAVALALLAKLVLTRTPIGVRLRAISDRQTAAELLGVNVKVLQIGVWAAIGAVMGLVVSIIGNTQAADAISMVTLIIPGAAAALVGAFKRLDLTILGGLIVGGAQGALNAFPTLILLKDWVPIVIIVLFLLWNQRKEVWDVAR